MIEHIALPVSNYERSKAFYAAALKPLGYKLNMEFPGGAGFMEGGHTSFLIEEKKRTEPTHVAFLAKSKEEVQKFYDAALAAGAKDNGAPGFRIDYGPDYYAAFILDTDSHNIEACYFGEKVTDEKVA